MLKRGLLFFVVVFLLGIIISGLVIGKGEGGEEIKIEEEVLEEFASGEKEVSVIVFLKEEKGSSEGKDSDKNLEKDLEKKKEEIKKVQKEILKDLDLKEEPKEVKGFLGVTFTEEDTSYELELEHEYSTVNALSGNLTKKGLKKLKEDPRVEKIYRTKDLFVLLNISVPLINANDAWNLSVKGTNINGTGETVCIVDTGVDYTHLNMGNCTNTTFLNGSCGKVIGGYDYVNDDADPWDDHGHGTHVAGIVASNHETYMGVAPEAKIVALKVCNSAGSCSTNDVIAGIDWCVDNSSKFNISVISISLVDCSNNNDYCNDDAMAPSINSAAAEDIIVSISTGNCNTNQCPGISCTTGPSSPACIENATAIGAVTNADAITFQRGDIFQLLAPGGTAIFSLNDGGGTTDMSGTSMAAPHFSGAVALFRQYWRLAYNQTPTQKEIEDKFDMTGKLIDDSSGSGNNFSRIDVLSAIQPFINFTSTSPANGTTISSTSTLINITSDVNLSEAKLEWDYKNGTLLNYTMNLSNGTAFYYNLTGLVTGNYSYKAHGNDTAGIWGVSKERYLDVDYTAPTITINHPLNGSYYKSKFNLNISISDLELDFSNYSLSNSSGNLIQTNSSSSINSDLFNWTDLVNVSNATFPDDNYTLTVFANDSLNNLATTEITFIVDKTPPAMFGFDRSPSTLYNDNQVWFYVNVTDTYLNSSKILIEGNWTGTFINYTMTLESGDKFNYSVSAENFSNGEIIAYKFYGFDLAGNGNSSALFNFTVQNRPPTANITSPANGTLVEVGEETQFNGTATDPDGEELSYNWSFGDGTIASGQNTTKTFESTGSFEVLLNVSDSFGGKNSTNITLIINDTKVASLITITYDTSVHWESEGNQSVDITSFDYSGIANLSLYFDSLLQSKNCSLQNNSHWICSWSWNISTAGDYTFIVNVTDNSTYNWKNSSTYSFSVTSCSDNAKNGDEGGTDCGGSCSSACSSGDSSSSGGGGGGGGGGGTATAVTTAAEEEAEVPLEEAGEAKAGAVKKSEEAEKGVYSTIISTSEGEGKAEVDNEEIAVKEIRVKTTEDKEFSIEIKSLKEKPAEVPDLEGAYQFLKMKMDLSEEELVEGTITFKVPKQWLLENNYDAIGFKVYSEGNWEEKEIVLVSEGEINTYQVKLKEFDYLAIVGEKKETEEKIAEEEERKRKGFFGFLEDLIKWNRKTKIFLGALVLVIISLGVGIYIISKRKKEAYQ